MIIDNFSSHVVVQLTQVLPVTFEGVEVPGTRVGFVIPDQVALKRHSIALFEQLHGIFVHEGTVAKTRRQNQSAVTGHILWEAGSSGQGEMKRGNSTTPIASWLRPATQLLFLPNHAASSLD